MKNNMPPVHPGAILREDILKEMKLSITKAAENLQVSRKQLSEVINEGAAISAEMAVRLEDAFGVNAEFWLDMQKHMIYGRLSIVEGFMAYEEWLTMK